MSNNDWIEIAVFIHGMTPDRNPEKSSTPTVLYKNLYENIQKELKAQGKQPFDGMLGIIWNWNPNEALGGTALYEDQTLSKAERIIGDQLNEHEKGVRTKNWLHYFLWKVIYGIGRDIVLYGLADAMYYISKDGETTVREHVFKYLCDEIIERLKADERKFKKVSITVLGHSAGSLIAHDFLYHLFSDRTPKASDVDQIHELRKMIGNNDDNPNQTSYRLRVRRLYTFGSPIAPWFIRANSLLQKVTKGERLKVTDIGLDAQAELENPRWVNFWALTDVAAFPLSFLYDDQEAVIDEYANVGLWFPNTHTAYWTLPEAEIAKRIARTF